MEPVSPGSGPLRGGLSKQQRSLLELLVTVAVAVIGVLLIRAEVASPYVIPSASMEPTLHCSSGPGCEGGHYSDRIIVNRLAFRFRAPARGEVVVFEAPQSAAAVCGAAGIYVKRIVGLPGELVSLRGGRVYIDGRLLSEKYIASPGHGSGRWPVPAKSYFMLGDNRSDSCDSRFWGAVGQEALIGPVLVTYWPPDRVASP